MSKRANPAVIGGFVIGAVVLAVIGVTLFGSGRLFRTTQPYVVYFTGDVNGLEPGAPVKFKGVEIGSVRDIFLNISEMGLIDTERRGGTAPEKVPIPVIIELDEDALMRKGSRFRPDPETVKLLVDAGLRAQLATESFVTGVLYVKLDLYPGSELKLVADPTVAYPEIPTQLTPFEEAQMKAAKFLAHLERVDLEGLVASLQTALDGINGVVTSKGLHDTLDALPATMAKFDQTRADMSASAASVSELSTNLGTRLDPTIESLRVAMTNASATLDATTQTMSNVRTLIASDSPVLYDLRRSLADLAEASRAIRRFADDLERNPSVLVRGRAVEKTGE
jgi:paraquat-inducible protein B